MGGKGSGGRAKEKREEEESAYPARSISARI